MKCQNFNALMNYQAGEINNHLSKHRYYLAEREIYLDGSALELDFIKTYYDEVCLKMRLTYCCEVCHIKTCSIREEFIKRDKIEDSENKV